MSATYNKFNAFVHDITHKVHDFDSDVCKVLLSNVAPTAANAVKTDITEISAGNGYSAGGPTATLSSNSQTSGIEKLKLNNALVTATGSIGPFRYAVLYNSTAASGNLVGYWDYGAALTLNTNDTFTVQFDATNGVFQIS